MKPPACQQRSPSASADVVINSAMQIAELIDASQGTRMPRAN
jgi:hypothetical protein